MRLAGRFGLLTLMATLASLYSVVDVQTKALAGRLQRTRETRDFGLGWFDAWRVSGQLVIAGGAGNTPSGGDAHLDVPLSNVAVMAFQGTDDFVAPRLFPIVDVDKQSNKYYIVDPDSWLRVPDTRRAPKVRPNRIEFRVSSDGYFANNFALAAENAKEDLANADAAMRLRENSTLLVTQALVRDMEVRIANKVTSISNIGSGVALSGANKWSDYVSSDPVADVTTGHAFIRQNTGLIPNTAVIDEDTFQIVRRHPVLLDMYKYTSGGQLDDAQVAALFKVQNLWRARGIKNMALEGATASMVNIWGNACLLAVVQPGMSLQTVTFGLAMRWTPEGIPAPFQVFRYDDPDPGKKVEVIEAGYYQDEKIVAPKLAYAITTTL